MRAKKKSSPLPSAFGAALEAAAGAVAAPNTSDASSPFYQSLRREMKKNESERKDYATVRLRSGGRCEVVLDGERCRKPHQETHHVIKRSLGGKFLGPDYLMGICREMHSLTDAALTQRTTLLDGTVYHGRLMIVASGGGRFKCWLESAPKGTTA